MKLPVSCMECLQENGEPGAFGFVELRDDGRYEVPCPYGHQTVAILQQQKFEILFEIGAHAILDGYYREAVSSFTSSLECFYEYAIKAILEKTTGSEELCKKSWIEISSQSERWLGAFIFMWAAYFGEVPTLISVSKLKFRTKDPVKFRNDVIHKGVIPTKDEAIRYGDAVLAVLIPCICTIQEKLPDMIRKLVFTHQRDSLQESDAGKKISWMGIKTLVSVGIGDPMPEVIPLEQYLESLAKTRWR